MENQVEKTSRHPDFTANRGPAAWRNSKGTATFLTVRLPGHAAMHFNETPEELRGAKSPRYTGQFGAVWERVSKLGNTYLFARLSVCPKPVVLFVNAPKPSA